MFGTFRKHSTWLWGIIIIGTVASFVYWGTNTGRQGGGVPVGARGSINGKVITEDAYLAARNEAVVRYFFMSGGEWPDVDAERKGFNLQHETYQLLLLIQELEKRDIYAGPEAKAKVVTGTLNSFRKAGINSLADFEKRVLTPQNLSLVDLDHYIEHQIGLRQLIATEGLAGEFLTPQQAESIYRRENQEISAQVVFFSASNYLSSVTIKPEALTNFFTRYMGNYRVPERVQLSYVAYPISNYLAKADEHLAAITNLDQQIDAVYLQRGTNFYNDVTPDEARKKIREEERHKYATLEARMDAATFADKVMSKDPVQPSNLDTIAQEQGLTVQVTKPFDKNSEPEGLDVPSTFAESAFKLREDEPFAGPVVGDDHVYVVALKSRLPSETPPLAQVMPRVAADYRLQQAVLMAREAGTNFVAQLTNSLTAGQSFSEVCTAAKLHPQLLPPFARSTRSLPEVEDHVTLNYFKQVAFATPVGRASDFTAAGRGGFVVYVQSELPVDATKMKEEMPRYLTYVRQTLQNEAFQRWFGRVSEIGLRETPLAQRQPPDISAPGQ